MGVFCIVFILYYTFVKTYYSVSKRIFGIGVVSSDRIAPIVLILLYFDSYFETLWPPPKLLFIKS